jgi:uncharacterized protein
LLSVLSTAILFPIFEEMIFRGILLSSFEQKFGRGLAILITSTLFAVVHRSIVDSPFLFASSFVVASLVCKGYGIHAAIIIHSFHNSRVAINYMMPNILKPEAISITNNLIYFFIAFFLFSVFLVIVCFRWLMQILDKDKEGRQTAIEPQAT